jgi:hypothetical protein
VAIRLHRIRAYNLDSLDLTPVAESQWRLAIMSAKKSPTAEHAIEKIGFARGGGACQDYYINW